MDLITESLNAEQFQQLPEKFRDYYQKQGEGYVLSVVPRNVNHSTLEAKRAAEAEAARLKEQVGSPDWEEARGLLEEKRRKEAEESAKAGNVESVLQKERAKLQAKYDKERAELEAKLNAATERESRSVRDRELTQAALRAGVVEGALRDVLLRGAHELKVVEGVLVDAEGAQVSADKWLKGQLAEAKHWLGASVGGGTQPRGGNGAPGSGNLKRSLMDHEAKAAYQKQYGMAAYNKLPY